MDNKKEITKEVLLNTGREREIERECGEVDGNR